MTSATAASVAVLLAVVSALQLLPMIPAAAYAAAAAGPPDPASIPDEAALREIFVGRCDTFQMVLRPDLFPKLKNCSQLWDRFRAAALGPSSCRSDPSNFADLMQSADHRVPENASVFWSGVMELVYKMQDLPEYFSIEKTLMGFTMNSLYWCNRNCNSSSGADIPLSDELLEGGQPEWLPEALEKGLKISEEICNNFTLTFWIAASRWFAGRAIGRAFIILNASVETPFRETSIFGQYELPRISQDRVVSMEIFLVQSLRDPRPSGAACRHSSVARLRALLAAKGIQATCTENPSFLVHILCADQPDIERCRLIGGASPAGPRPSSGLVAAASAFAFLAVLLAQRSRDEILHSS